MNKILLLLSAVIFNSSLSASLVFNLDTEHANDTARFSAQAAQDKFEAKGFKRIHTLDCETLELPLEGSLENYIVAIDVDGVLLNKGRVAIDVNAAHNILELTLRGCIFIIASAYVKENVPLGLFHEEDFCIHVGKIGMFDIGSDDEIALDTLDVASNLNAQLINAGYAIHKWWEPCAFLMDRENFRLSKDSVHVGEHNVLSVDSLSKGQALIHLKEKYLELQQRKNVIFVDDQFKVLVEERKAIVDFNKSKTPEQQINVFLKLFGFGKIDGEAAETISPRAA